MSLKSKIESLLFITNHPIPLSRLAELTGASKDEVKKELDNLFVEYDLKEKGINIQKIGNNYEMVTNSENGKIVADFLKEEVTGELTPASLETLTVIAYRGPITRTELELIRGVNCAIILRNLMMRGLIEEIEDKQQMVAKYQITFDFLKHLGINETSQLPDFIRLNSNESMEQILNQEVKSDNEAEGNQ
ncbi:MAG: SMC-Scp complex subunit ScpB [Patescibacteria group bacterium]|nr:SMC-Scp complex subunit ScpB [Patescibacteria group bacterium]